MQNSLLKNRNYCLLQGANLINRLGDNVDAIALSWLVYEVSGNASVSAVNFAINYLPTVFLQPLMGAMVARKDKKSVMVFADAMRMIIVAVLALTVLSGHANTPIILTATFLMSCFETLRLPSANAIIPLVITEDEYKAAVSFSSSLSRMAELIGMGLAGLIVGIFGIYTAIFFDAFSFGVSALILSLMKIKETIKPSKKKRVFFKDFKDGLAYAYTNKIILYLCIIAALANMLMVPFNALQSAFVTDFYHGDAAYLSLMGIALSLGSLLGAALYPKVSTLIKSKMMIVILFFAGSFYYLGLLLAGYLADRYLLIAAIIIVNFITGVIIGIANCHLSVLLMIKTPQDYLSRIGSLSNAFSTSMIPIASFIVSALVSFISLEALFALSGIIILVLGVFLSLTKKMEVLNE